MRARSLLFVALGFLLTAHVLASGVKEEVSLGINLDTSSLWGYNETLSGAGISGGGSGSAAGFWSIIPGHVYTLSYFLSWAEPWDPWDYNPYGDANFEFVVDAPEGYDVYIGNGGSDFVKSRRLST